MLVRVMVRPRVKSESTSATLRKLTLVKVWVPASNLKVKAAFEWVPPVYENVELVGVAAASTRIVSV